MTGEGHDGSDDQGTIRSAPLAPTSRIGAWDARTVLGREIRQTSPRHRRMASLWPRCRDALSGQEVGGYGRNEMAGTHLEADRPGDSIDREDLSMQILGYVIAIIAFAAAGLLSLVR